MADSFDAASLFDVSKVPCFRQSLMWSIVTGTAGGLHGWRTHGTALAAGDLALKMFVATAGVTW
jgi:hypothetical protein